MRICFTNFVPPANHETYKQAHQQVWPEMLEALRDAGWRDYHLYLRSDGLLVGSVETDSYEAAQSRMALTEVNVRWQAAMSRMFGTTQAPDSQMTVLEPIFNLEAQLTQAGLPTKPATEPNQEPGPQRQENH